MCRSSTPHLLHTLASSKLKRGREISGRAFSTNAPTQRVPCCQWLTLEHSKANQMRISVAVIVHIAQPTRLLTHPALLSPPMLASTAAKCLTTNCSSYACQCARCVRFNDVPLHIRSPNVQSKDALPVWNARLRHATHLKFTSRSTTFLAQTQIIPPQYLLDKLLRLFELLQIVHLQRIVYD